MTVANDALTPELTAPAPSAAPRGSRSWAWLLVAFALVSFARVLTGSQRARLVRHPARGDHRDHPDRAGRPRRAVVRACGRGQHRPRGDDDPRHHRGRATSATSTAPGRASSPRCCSAPSAARCTRWPPSSSASTTSCPASRSTSWRSASRRSWRTCGSPGCRAAARPSRRRSTARSQLNLPAVADWAKSVEDKHWFLVSDLASVVGALTRDLSSLTMLSRCCWSSRRTSSSGARRSACGCAPAARAPAPPRRWA